MTQPARSSVPLFFARCAAILLLVAAVGCSSPSEPQPSAAAVEKAAAVRPAPATDSLPERLDRAIADAKRRHLVADTNAAWQVVHGILAFGPDLQLDVLGKPTSALKYLLEGGRLNGWVLLPGDKGLEAVLEAGSKSGQGHEDQWLGYLSLCDLPADTPIKVAGRTFTVQDLVTQAQWDIYPRMEATWSLMGFARYLPLDARWKSKDGSEWTIERVAAMEAAEDLRTSACGGTHRLVGLTVAVNRHLAEGGKLTGGWQAAHDRIQESLQTVRAFQQPDGSFSSEYFKQPSDTPDLGLRISTTGHTLEFVALALPEEALREPWVEQAATCLCDLLEQTKDFELECGGLYHAVRGLQIYRQRRFGPPAQGGEKRPAAAHWNARPGEAVRVAAG